LLPGSEPTSEHRHRVVELSSGIVDEHELLVAGSGSPVAKLKEALTSKRAFQKYYLVMALKNYFSQIHTITLTLCKY
jgi:hypothetical protein